MPLKYWLAVMFEDTAQLLDIARAAEELGFYGIAVADHVAVPENFASVHPSGENPLDHRSDFPDPFTTIAAMSVVTERLRFMTYVYVLPMRDPFTVAKQTGTLARMSGERFGLGVGAGWLVEEIALLGHDPGTRGRRMDEMIAVVRGFLDEGVAEFHGEFYDFGPTGMFPVPERHVPIWVGGKSPAALARAARNDGWLGMNYDPEEIPGLLAALAEERRRVEESRGPRPVPFETLVIPNSLPTPERDAELAEQGVTATVAVPWPPGSPEFASLEDKRAAMEDFAGRMF